MPAGSLQLSDGVIKADCVRQPTLRTGVSKFIIQRIEVEEPEGAMSRTASGTASLAAAQERHAIVSAWNPDKSWDDDPAVRVPARVSDRTSVSKPCMYCHMVEGHPNVWQTILLLFVLKHDATQPRSETESS